MPLDGVRVLGTTGPLVVLLPGGAAATDGFFPGLPEGLVADPGCRVVLHDRPGTGDAATGGTLAGAAAHLKELVDELGGPAVVVGQSLGGAVAVLLARDHPESVAGLVLLDPTPVNDPASCVRIERMMTVLDALARVPLLGRGLGAALRAAAARRGRALRLRPDCAAAYARISDIDVPQLARATRGLADLSRGLREADLPRVPTVVATADRPEGHAVRAAHDRLATAFGGTTVTWPGADHAVHLTHPDETLGVVRDLVRRVSAGTAPR